jgi:hypothetical protein
MPINANLSINNYFSHTLPANTIHPQNHSADSRRAVAIMSVVEKTSEQATLEVALRQIADAARTIRYGSIEVVIHEGRIVQIERREKIRIGKPGC